MVPLFERPECPMLSLIEANEATARLAWGKHIYDNIREHNFQSELFRINNKHLEVHPKGQTSPNLSVRKELQRPAIVTRDAERNQLPKERSKNEETSQRAQVTCRKSKRAGDGKSSLAETRRRAEPR